MKIFVAGGTAIGRPLIAELLAKGHTLKAKRDLNFHPRPLEWIVGWMVDTAVAHATG